MPIESVIDLDRINLPSSIKNIFKHIKLLLSAETIISLVELNDLCPRTRLT